MADMVLRGPNHPKINASEVALKYAQSVHKGKTVAGKLVVLACKRFLLDLKHGADRGLVFKSEEAQRVVDFFGFLRHSKGEWGGKVFELAPWQVFILVNLFGWYRRDGTRRFHEAHIEVARKNGKSTFLAGIGLYMLVMDDEPGAEVYSAATKKDQASIVFDEACRMRKSTPFLSQRVKQWRGNLSVEQTYSKFEPLSSDYNTLDGLNCHCNLVDELHAHVSNELYQVLIEATKARRNPMTIAITTAGFNRQGVCFKQRSHGERILQGSITASDGDSFFAFIACMEQGEDPFDEKNWAKGNPNLGISVKIEGLREAAIKAKEEPTSLNSFLRKHMNVWTTQDVRWMPPDKWAACCAGAGPNYDVGKAIKAAMELLKGRICFGGLDLSSKIDLTSFVLVFPPKGESKVVTKEKFNPITRVQEPIEWAIVPADTRWHALAWFWVPEGNVGERVRKDRVPYDVWIRQGFINTTPGNIVDQTAIRAHVNKMRDLFQIAEIGFDSWNATQLSVELDSDGIKMVEARQGYKTMSEPMKNLMGMVSNKQFEHYGNPVLSWNVENVAATTDPADNIKPDKEKSKERIDGAVAAIMALSRVVANPTAGVTAYSDRGIVFL